MKTVSVKVHWPAYIRTKMVSGGRPLKVNSF